MTVYYTEYWREEWKGRDEEDADDSE